MIEVSGAGQQFPGGTNDPKHSFELFQHHDAEETNLYLLVPSFGLIWLVVSDAQERSRSCVCES